MATLKTTFGLDLGNDSTEVCGIDAAGSVSRFSVKTTKTAIRKTFSQFEPSRIILEVGADSPWMSRLLAELGHEVTVANTRRLHVIAKSDSKNDRSDAEMLARLGRLDLGILSPVIHRSERAQRDLVLIRARDGLVRARVLLVNQVRGFVKALGERCPSSSTEAFPKRVREKLSDDFFPGLSTMLSMIDQLTATIRSMDREVERVCKDAYPEAQRLRQITGVGPITALCFVLTLDDPHRFKKSRSVGAFLGLRPRQQDSGMQRPKLSITKAGDRLLRRLLVSASQYILGPFGPDTDLRRFGLRLAASGGRAPKKRAVVAVARKLSVLMHRLWVSGEDYEPLRLAGMEGTA